MSRFEGARQAVAKWFWRRRRESNRCLLRLSLMVWFTVVVLEQGPALAHTHTGVAMPPASQNIPCPQPGPGNGEGCSSCAGGCPCCPFDSSDSPATPPSATDNPVYLAFGCPYEPVTDLRLSAPGVDWKLGRTFSSTFSDPFVTPQGAGWLSDPADIFLYTYDNGTIINLLVNGVAMRVFVYN